MGSIGFLDRQVLHDIAENIVIDVRHDFAVLGCQRRNEAG